MNNFIIESKKAQYSDILKDLDADIITITKHNIIITFLHLSYWNETYLNENLNRAKEAINRRLK